MWVWVTLLAVAAGIAYLSVRPGDCVIRSRSGEVVIAGKITQSQRLAVEHYLKSHFPDAGRVRIDLRYPRSGQRLKVRIRGSLAEGQRQMIRNFLLTEF